MKRLTTVFLLALLMGGLCASAVQATPSRGADCSQCHAFSNQPPVANAGSDQTVTAGATVTLNGSGSSDPDDGIASYAWVQTGTGTAVTLTNTGTQTATFKAPSVTARTMLTFQLTVKDSLNQASTDTCTITINPASTPTNQPPVANAGPDQIVTPGEMVRLNGSGSSDPDDGIASYSWAQSGTLVVSLSSSTVANPTFTAPKVTVATNLTFTLTVKDKVGQSGTDTCIVRVNPIGGGGGTNAPPVANAGLDLNVLPGSYVTLNGFSSTDADDSTLIYAWTQTAGPAVTLSNPSAMDPIFLAPSTPATLSFTLTVIDPSGAQASDSCTVVVLDPNGGGSTAVNEPPVARAGKDKTVRPKATVRLSGSGSSDPDDGIASYQWQQVSGPSVRLSKANSAKASFTAPRSSGSALTFRLTVKDKAGASAADTVVVKVSRSGDDEDDD